MSNLEKETLNHNLKLFQISDEEGKSYKCDLRLSDRITGNISLEELYTKQQLCMGTSKQDFINLAILQKNNKEETK